MSAKLSVYPKQKKFISEHKNRSAILISVNDGDFNRSYRDYELTEYVRSVTGVDIYTSTLPEVRTRLIKQKSLYQTEGEKVYTFIGGFNIEEIFNSGNCLHIHFQHNDSTETHSLYSNISFGIKTLLEADWRRFEVLGTKRGCPNS